MSNNKNHADSNHYSSRNYDTFERMQSYLLQIKEITAINPERLLEIGVGNGFLSEYLRKNGFNVTTCDIDERLNPDKVGSVLALPFTDNSFDLVACFQVLEHLPFSEFIKALSEIKRVTKQTAIISLPDVERCFKFSFSRNKSSYFRKYILIPKRKKPKNSFNGEHYWEIGKDSLPLEKICSDIDRAGFGISRTYKIFENDYHRLFVLQKTNNGVHFKYYTGNRLGNIEGWRSEYFEEPFKLKNIFYWFLTIIKRTLRII